MGIVRFRYMALAGALQLAAFGACSSEPIAVSGACAVDPNPELGCGSTPDGTVDEALGLVGYSCTGSARPDQDPTYLEGVPSGLVCADRGPVGPEGKQGYCCTAVATPCAYNP